jgi:hypothetical protein
MNYAIQQVREGNTWKFIQNRFFEAFIWDNIYIKPIWQMTDNLLPK